MIYNPYLDSGPKLAIMLGLLAVAIPCYFTFVKVSLIDLFFVKHTILH